MAVPSRKVHVTIEAARWPAALPLARAMFLEYAESLNFDLCFQGFEPELAGLPGGYASPDGGLWFARVDGAAAGIVALRPFGDARDGGARDGGDDRVCEMKRLWVRPAYRGLGLGRRLALLTLEAARTAGYRRMRLDTLPFMALRVRCLIVIVLTIGKTIAA